MPRKSHTHKYILRPTGASPVWACALDFCGHYMPSHLTPLVEGRMSICWSCDEAFKMDSEAMQSPDGKPYCSECRLINSGHTPIIPHKSESVAPIVEKVDPDKDICIKCHSNPQRASASFTKDGLCVACWAKSQGIV